MFCRKCGNIIPDDSEFCFKCGAAVQKEEEKVINSQLWVYNNAIKEFENAQSIEDLEQVESTFKELGDYKDSAEYAKKCRENKFPLLYDSTVLLLKTARSTQEYLVAEKNLQYLGSYKDSEQLLAKCQYDLKLSRYNDAYIKSKAAETADDYLQAEKMFRALGDFEDAAQQADGCLEGSMEKRYAAADEALKIAESAESLARAAKEFEALGGYKDAAIKADKARKSTALLDKYNEAYEKMQAAFSTNPNSEALFYEAESIFSALGTFRESSALCKTCIYNANVIKFNRALDKLSNVCAIGDAESCREEFAALGNFYTAKKMVSECDKVIHNFSVLDKLKSLIAPLECSNDIDTLVRARRKAFLIDGAGNSQQLVEEFDRKIECVKSDRPFRPAKLKPALTANVDFSKRAFFKTELSSEELSQVIKPSEANYSKQQVSAKSSSDNLIKQPQGSSTNPEKQSQSPSVKQQPQSSSSSSTNAPANSPSETLQCKVCGRALLPSWEVCSYCSEPNPYYQKSSSPSSTNTHTSEGNSAPIAQTQQYCTFCHSIIPLNLTECPNCGVKIKKDEPISVGHKYCRFCGYEIDNNTKVCPHCGTTIKSAAPAENRTNNQSADDAEDGLKTFAGWLGVIYALVVMITVLCLFGSGNCACTSTPFEVEYYVPAGQTFAGVVLGGAAVVGILCLIYKITHIK